MTYTVEQETPTRWLVTARFGPTWCRKTVAPTEEAGWRVVAHWKARRRAHR